jgi:hypothetical protein
MTIFDATTDDIMMEARMRKMKADIKAVTKDALR